jgi:AraC-like DNA-binding protein
MFPERVSDTLGICLLTGGSHQVVFDGRKLDIPANSILLRRPGSIWSTPRSTIGFVCIDIGRDLLPEDARWHHDTFVPASALPAIVDIADRLVVEEDRLAQQERIVRLIETVVDFGFSRTSEADSEHPHAAAIARDYLETCYASNVSLDDLAFLAGTNRFSLIRMFRRAYNVTPHAFQIRLRIERACRLLRAGIPVHEIAPIVGFSDQSHLTRHFARVVGLTPARYARTVRASYVG